MKHGAGENLSPQIEIHSNFQKLEGVEILDAGIPEQNSREKVKTRAIKGEEETTGKSCLIIRNSVRHDMQSRASEEDGGKTSAEEEVTSRFHCKKAKPVNLWEKEDMAAVRKAGGEKTELRPLAFGKGH